MRWRGQWDEPWALAKHEREADETATSMEETSAAAEGPGMYHGANTEPGLQRRVALRCENTEAPRTG